MNNYLATLEWRVEEKWDHQLLRRFLREQCHISKRALADIKFNGGLILQNKQEVTVRSNIHIGDIITVCLPTEEVSLSVIPEFIDLDIAYEDDHLLVINKRAGMATIPSREHPSGTLANAILGFYKKKKHQATFHAVNRLDKDTSGLLIIAKHRLAHDRLSNLQKEGRLKRYYTAIVSGYVKNNTDTINAPIGRDSNSIIARMVREDGKSAVTHFYVKARSRDKTVVEIKLETGRTHQIRVHFAFIGHPLLGDDLYGGSCEELKRQALHCHQIEFQHPFEDKVVTIHKELPTDMKRFTFRE